MTPACILVSCCLLVWLGKPRRLELHPDVLQAVVSNKPVLTAQAVSQPTAQATPLSPSHPSMAPCLSPGNGHTNGNVDSLSLFAKAYARQSGQQLKVLGEAGFKYLSGAVENWRAGSAVDDNSVKMSSGGGPGLLYLSSPHLKGVADPGWHLEWQAT